MHLGVVKYSHVILNRTQNKSEGAQKLVVEVQILQIYSNWIIAQNRLL